MHTLYIDELMLLREISRWLKRLPSVIYILFRLIKITIATLAFVLNKSYIELVK